MTILEITTVKSLTEPCDGQCGGSINLVTDGEALAYATVETEWTSRYAGGECDLVERHADGSIEVMCGAQNLVADETCSGAVHLDAAVVADAEGGYHALAAFMVPMEVEG